jgi:hypothetical protein
MIFTLLNWVREKHLYHIRFSLNQSLLIMEVAESGVGDTSLESLVGPSNEIILRSGNRLSDRFPCQMSRQSQSPTSSQHLTGIWRYRDANASHMLQKLFGRMFVY